MCVHIMYTYIYITIYVCMYLQCQYYNLYGRIQLQRHVSISLTRKLSFPVSLSTVFASSNAIENIELLEHQHFSFSNSSFVHSFPLSDSDPFFLVLDLIATVIDYRQPPKQSQSSRIQSSVWRFSSPFCFANILFPVIVSLRDVTSPSSSVQET